MLFCMSVIKKYRDSSIRRAVGTLGISIVLVALNPLPTSLVLAFVLSESMLGVMVSFLPVFSYKNWVLFVLAGFGFVQGCYWCVGIASEPMSDLVGAFIVCAFFWTGVAMGFRKGEYS